MYIKNYLHKFSVINILFLAKEEKCFMHRVWDFQGRSLPTKPLPVFSSNKVTFRKSKSCGPKALNEIMLPTRRKKSLTISHTQHRTPPISIPISTKEKKWGREKKWDPHRQQEKRKNRMKVKRKQISYVKLNHIKVKNIKW